jgi:4-hydroxy-tetrahydrodipicolinate synthase
LSFELCVPDPTAMTLSGLFVPLVTPFSASGEVALDALEALADRVLSEGATGLVALGTTGEPSALSAPERAAVVEVVSGVCAARGAPVLVGASPPDLSSLPRSVTAALVLVPPFVRPGEDGVLAYFASIVSPVPLVVYHVPARTGQDLSASLLGRLAALPSVIGMKYAPGALSADAVAVFGCVPSSFAVLCGDDPMLVPMLALGAAGSITASAQVAPSAYASLVSSSTSVHASAPRSCSPALGHRVNALSSALFAEPNPTVIKGVLHAQGHIPTASVRLPLLAAASSTVDTALACLSRAS